MPLHKILDPNMIRNDNAIADSALCNSLYAVQLICCEQSINDNNCLSTIVKNILRRNLERETDIILVISEILFKT